VLPFRTPEENALLPDPHAKVTLSQELDRIHAILRSPALPPRALEAQTRAIETLAEGRENGNNPEIQYLLGDACRRLAEARAGQGLSSREHLERAEAAWLQSFRLGRKDDTTLALACGVNAVDREPEALRLLHGLLPQLPERGCDTWVLEARLLQATGDLEGAERACEAAREACSHPRQRGRWERTCR
jgi:hypothetical protein